MFDLGIYGGGAYTTDWFSDPQSTDPTPFDDTPKFWLGSIFGHRSSEIFLPGAGTVFRGGQEVHLLTPGTERVTGATGGIGFGFKVNEQTTPVPVNRVFFSYNYFEGSGDRSTSVAPGTENVAFTFDEIFVFPGGGTSTGVGAGPLGMNAAQNFDLREHRVQFGAVTPFPVGPATVIVNLAATGVFSSQDYRSQLSLVTLPDIQMTETRDITQRLFGPTLGGAIQVPFVLPSGTPGSPPPIAFLTIGGDASVLFGETDFRSSQVMVCPLCGPNFPVTVTSSADITDPIFEAGAYLRGAVTVGPRGLVFGEVGGKWTERGNFITPANPNQQPIRFETDVVSDWYVRFGGSFALGAPPPR